MARPFALEIRQDGVWVHKGTYSSLDTAVQCFQRRFPGWDVRVINRESGYVEYTMLGVNRGTEEEPEVEIFESFDNILGAMDLEARRFENTENWHRRFTERDQRDARLREQRLLVRRRQILDRFALTRANEILLESQKNRKAHIKWWSEGF